MTRSFSPFDRTLKCQTIPPDYPGQRFLLDKKPIDRPGLINMHNCHQGRTPQILLIERDASIRGMVSDFLLEEGYLVPTREYSLDPADIPNLQPDLIVLDIPAGATSPELDFVRDLKSKAHTANIPILALCRLLPSKDVPAWTQQNGVAGLLRKPFDLDELLDAVQSAIDSANVASHAARRETSVHRATPETQPRS